MSKYITLRGRYGEGKYAIVDDEDYYRFCSISWSVNNSGYVTGVIKVGKSSSLHSAILETDSEIDHINGNKLDNRRCNLRVCTRSQNNMNKSKSKYKYKGVFPNKKGNRWRTQITLHRKTYCLGTFDNQEDAAEAYNKKALELFGEFARINSI